MSTSVRHLLEGFVPAHYELALEPDRERLRFGGTVTIRGRKVGRPSKRLTFHQKELVILAATVTRHDKKGNHKMEVTRINPHKAYDEVRLHTTENLLPGEYTIELRFNGAITKPMNGMYPCYFEEKGKPKMLIATQFESHHAREVFPCIDEPAAKATFDLTLTTPAGPKEAVLANTPIKKQKTIDGKVVSTFETTPLMSTYLLAFVFGEMKHLEAKTKSGTVVRTYATPENTAFTEFALDVGVRCLDFYEDYFGIPYPLAKCDMVALPDFASGAMENWGLITYREQTLLVDPKNTSVPTKQYVTMVIAHELAHQWFGNLVTMRWWTDLWLNEGFASWIEYLAVDNLFPDWGMWTQFIVDEQQSALKLDALEHTHPIEVPVHHPDEIRTIFDTISYNKGASAIHMLYTYLGAKDFRDGLRHYLQQHAYDNTDTVDLWAALEHSSGKPVKRFMHAWTSQPGYPLISVKVDEPVSGRGNIELNQKRFYLNPDAKRTPENWPVPLLASHGLRDHSFTSSRHTATYRIEDETEIFKLNHNNAGFYRTVYDSAYVKHLRQAVEDGRLGPEDRLGLLSDSFDAAKAGFTPTTDALELMSAYHAENHVAVWDIIAMNIGEIRRVMDDEELRDDMKPYVRKLVAAELARLGWEPKKNESYFDTLLRPTILALAANADEQAVVEECKRRFKAMKNPDDIEPDLRGVIYGTVARLGGKAEFNKLLKMHNESTSSEERLVLCGALTGFEKPAEYRRALEQIDSKDVRLQDAMYWLAYSFMNRHARAETWEWMKSHWKWLTEYFAADLAFPRLPVYAARVFSDKEFLKEFTVFFDSVRTPSLERAINQGVETLQWQSAWKKRDLVLIKRFFKTHTNQ